MVEYEIEKFPLIGVKQTKKYDGIFHDNKTGKYPVADGTFELGYLKSSVAVVLPTPDNSLELLSVKHGAAIAGSLNTSGLGIEILVANILSNPNIRNIIVFGEDSPSFHPGKSLVLLKENGVDSEGYIIGADERWGANIRRIDMKTIAKFQKQIVNVVDLLGENDSSLLSKIVHYCIQEPENAIKLTGKGGKEYILFDPGPSDHNPCYISIEKGVPGKIIDKVHLPYCSSFVAETISQAYNLLWANVNSQGNDVTSQYGPTKELMNCVVHITKPLKDFLAIRGDQSGNLGELISSYRFEDFPITKNMLQNYLDVYAQTLMSPEKVKPVFNRSTKKFELKPSQEEKYTYGQRFRGYEHRDVNGKNKKRDNFSMVIQSLSNAIKKKENSRRCVVSLIDPVYDLSVELEDIEPPCITNFYFNPRQQAKKKWVIYGTMVMRSHDVRRAFVANVYAFSKMVEEACNKVQENFVGTDIKIEMGPITIFFISLHEYV